MENINTYGWDMVLAVKTSFINSNLSSKDQHFTEVVEMTGQSVTVKCDTKCWQIATGGSDALVNFKIPCSKMSLDNGKKSVTVTNGYCLVQTKLGLVSAENGIHELRIQTNDSSIKVLDVSFPDSEFSGFVSYATLACQNWLDKITNIDYVLATIKLNSSDSQGSTSGLIPTSATYAYTDSKNDDDGILGLLCYLDGKTDLAGSLQQISTDAIQSGESSILINSDIIQNWFQPSVSATTWANQPGVKADVENPLDYQVILKS
jgi:hypothetical protein